MSVGEELARGSGDRVYFVVAPREALVAAPAVEELGAYRVGLGRVGGSGAGRLRRRGRCDATGQAARGQAASGRQREQNLAPGGTRSVAPIDFHADPSRIRRHFTDQHGRTYIDVHQYATLLAG